ncbi:MAG: squalene/phytoene synthase family protein [Roseobacter sp.]
MTFDPDTIACAAMTEKSDPDRFAATMSLPVAARAKLFPLWAFNIEVARAPWVTKEPLIAEMRLQWWHDALDEIAARGFVRRHEVVTPLATLLSPAQAESLTGLVAARKRDIEKTFFEDEAALWQYLDATAGTLHWGAASLLGAPAADEGAVRKAARAMALANWMCALPELEARGKQPLPDGRPETLQRLAREALAGLAAQRSLSKASRQALLSGFQSRAILKQVVAAPTRVAQNRLHAAPLKRSARLIRARMTGRI